MRNRTNALRAQPEMTQACSEPEKGAPRQRWFRRITVRVPTWRLWLPAFLLALLALGTVARWAHPFLSLNAPVTANVMVVEGWLPDYALAEAAEAFRANDYRLLIASGGPLEQGSLVTGYATYADLAAASLLELGIPPDRLVAAPAKPTYRHRTHVSAQGVEAYLDEVAFEVQGVNVVSVGTHARRTLTVYRKLLADRFPVGVLSLPSRDYDPERWWASSQGVKGTITEALGWLHEWLVDGGR